MQITRKPDYSDLDLDFIAHPATGDIVKKTSIDAVKRSVRNLILTNFYDRPFRSHIGSNATKLLFENASPLIANFLQNAIAEVIRNFEPRVTLRSIAVTVSEDENGYEASIVFSVNNQLEPIRTTIFLELIRS